MSDNKHLTQNENITPKEKAAPGQGKATFSQNIKQNSHNYPDSSDIVTPFDRYRKRPKLVKSAVQPKAKSKLKNVGCYFVIDCAAVNVIQLHPPIPGVSTYDLLIAYATLCKSVQQGITPRITTAGAKSIGNALACGVKHKQRVFSALKSIVFADGVPIISQASGIEWGGYRRPAYELPQSAEYEPIYFPNATLDKMSANPKTAHREVDKTRISADALVFFLVLFRHYEPIEYWGFNPITSMRNAYAERDSMTHELLSHTEIVAGYQFTFYKKPRMLRKVRTAEPGLVAEVLQKPESQLTPDDYQRIHSLTNELFKRGYLMFSVIVVDTETNTPLYNLHTRGHDKSTKSNVYKPLQDDVLNLYAMLTGNEDKRAELSKNYYVSVTRKQQTEVIGIYSPTLLPGCPESVSMKKSWAENRAFWADFCQCQDLGV